MPAISAARPEAVSTAARTAPVPGQSPPGIGIVGSWLVAKQGGAAVERQLRGQQLLVVEAAVAGDDDDAGAAPGLALEHGRAGLGDHLLQRRRPDHEGAAAVRRLAGEPRDDHPGGDDPLRPDLDPEAAQPLRVLLPAAASGCW